MLAAGLSEPVTASCTSKWPDWQQFADRFISADGRVIDPSTPRAVTVSEGQAYALFFALVADDRPRFGRLLEWTENNLAAGDLTRNLPAWQWGRRDDGRCGIIQFFAFSETAGWQVAGLVDPDRLRPARRCRSSCTRP